MSQTEPDYADFVFEPNGWDFATEIGICVDPVADRRALEELADAMLVWVDGPLLERLTDTAVERLWDDELTGWVRAGIVRLSERTGWEQAARLALAEFDRDPRNSDVAREVVRHLAMQLGQCDHPVFFCLDCLDEAVSNAPADDRRALALGAAIVAARDAAIADADLRAVLAVAASHPPAVGLATIARREAVRARLGRLGELGKGSMPTLATELRGIAAEPLPARAEDDDVWQLVCVHLLAEKARPELN